MSRTLSYLLILIGGFVAIYARAEQEQNQFLLIGGIVILMLGVYSIARNIPSKNDSDDDHNNQQE